MQNSIPPYFPIITREVYIYLDTSVKRIYQFEILNSVLVKAFLRIIVVAHMHWASTRH